MTARVEFFFDLSSPWTCLAFHNLPGVLERTGATAIYRPILVGGVFNAVNPAVYATREQTDNRRLQHSWKVLQDWARLADVPMNFPSEWHPAKSIAAMRFCCALEEDQAALGQFARGAFASYFDRQENLDDPAVIARGGYGSPSIFVDGDDMYFGNDQLPLVEAALLRTRA